MLRTISFDEVIEVSTLQRSLAQREALIGAKVVDPQLFSRDALTGGRAVEEQHIRFDTLAIEDPSGQSQQGVEVEVLQQFTTQRFPCTALEKHQPVEGRVIMAVAAVGIVVNGVTAWLFASGRKGDINIRGAFLHMAADAAVSAGVVVAGFLVLRTGWLWLDPAMSLVIVVVILIGTWGLLRSSVAMSLDRVPESIAPAQVTAALVALRGVTKVHDLHIWSMSTTEVALTCHFVMPEGCPGDSFLHDASAMLHNRFEIGHSTIQVEQDEHDACSLAPNDVV